MVIGICSSFDPTIYNPPSTVNLIQNYNSLPFAAEFAFSSTEDVLTIATDPLDTPPNVIDAAIPNSFDIFIVNPEGTPHAGGMGYTLANGISYSTGNLLINTPPTPAQLSQMSLEAYSSNPSNIAGFSLDGPPIVYKDGFVADVYSNPDNSQVVLAIRGTDTSVLKNLIADAAIGTGKTNDTLNGYVSDARKALTELAAKYHTANITLTGHSLGGTIAQLLAKAANLSSVSFDAPGAAKLYPAYESALSSLSGIGSNFSSVNYRLYGDQYSLLGSQLGSSVTVGTTGVPSQILNGTNIFADHNIDTLSNYLQSSATLLTPGVIGPDLSNEINNIFVPVVSNFPVCTPACTTSLTFVQTVSAIVDNYFDPGGYGSYALTSNAGSPFFHSLTLPSLEDVASYDVRYELGNTWSAFQKLAPETALNFGVGVDGFQFEPLDINGKDVQTPGFFLFDLTFDSSGTFNRTLIESISEAPEPQSWTMLILGVAVAGVTFRRRRFNLSTRPS